MTKLTVSLAFCMLVMAAPGSAQAPAPSQPSIDLPEDVSRVLRDYERDWAAGDAAALARLFTPDGFAGSRSGWVRGRDAIQAEYQRAGGSLRLRAHAWKSDGDVGYLIGSYGYGADADAVDGGRFVLALQRVEGRWLIAADLDAANR